MAEVRFNVTKWPVVKMPHRPEILSEVMGMFADLYAGSTFNIMFPPNGS